MELRTKLIGGDEIVEHLADGDANSRPKSSEGLRRSNHVVLEARGVSDTEGIVESAGGKRSARGERVRKVKGVLQERYFGIPVLVLLPIGIIGVGILFILATQTSRADKECQDSNGPHSVWIEQMKVCGCTPGYKLYQDGCAPY